MKKLLVLLLVLVLMSVSVSAYSVNSGNLLNTEDLAVRYKSFANTGSKEVYLGVPDLGVGANRVEADHVWAHPGPTGFLFSYSSSSDEIITALDSWPGSITFGLEEEYKLNALVFHVVERHAEGTEVKVDKLVINEEEIDGKLATTDGWNTWTVCTGDISDGFQVTGDITMEGSYSGGDESSKVEIIAGYSRDCVEEPNDVPEFGLLGAGLAVLGVLGFVVFRKRD